MLLLVEDNTAIAENIVGFLELKGYKVDHCIDGSSGLEKALEKTYDCIILDVMMPGMDGFQLLEKLREQKSTPVIMTTAKGQIEDKSSGFDLGADDYLVKPFELKELLMRVEAILKRTQTSEVYSYGEIEVHIDDNEILKHGEKIDLPLKERQILSLLIEAEGRGISRADIISEIRGEDSLRENDGKLDVYISNLRKKLEKEMIETIKGFGYKVPKSRK